MSLSDARWHAAVVDGTCILEHGLLAWILSLFAPWPVVDRVSYWMPGSQQYVGGVACATLRRKMSTGPCYVPIGLPLDDRRGSLSRVVLEPACNERVGDADTASGSHSGIDAAVGLTVVE